MLIYAQLTPEITLMHVYLEEHPRSSIAIVSERMRYRDAHVDIINPKVVQIMEMLRLWRSRRYVRCILHMFSGMGLEHKLEQDMRNEILRQMFASEIRWSANTGWYFHYFSSASMSGISVCFCQTKSEQIADKTEWSRRLDFSVLFLILLIKMQSIAWARNDGNLVSQPATGARRQRARFHRYNV